MNKGDICWLLAIGHSAIDSILVSDPPIVPIFELGEFRFFSDYTTIRVFALEYIYDKYGGPVFDTVMDGEHRLVRIGDKISEYVYTNRDQLIAALVEAKLSGAKIQDTLLIRELVRDI